MEYQEQPQGRAVLREQLCQIQFRPAFFPIIWLTFPTLYWTSTAHAYEWLSILKQPVITHLPSTVRMATYDGISPPQGELRRVVRQLLDCRRYELKLVCYKSPHEIL